MSAHRVHTGLGVLNTMMMSVLKRTAENVLGAMGNATSNIDLCLGGYHYR